MIDCIALDICEQKCAEYMQAEILFYLAFAIVTHGIYLILLKYEFEHDDRNVKEKFLSALKYATMIFLAAAYFMVRFS